MNTATGECHEQIPLFGSFNRRVRSPRPAPLAAAADPVSSHLAAAEITASGQRDSQKRAILSALREQLSPCTSMELARAAGIDRYIVARRLPDLERDGLVERGQMRNCDVTGRPAIAWRAKETGR
jgi:hypothetical protein